MQAVTPESSTLKTGWIGVFYFLAFNFCTVLVLTVVLNVLQNCQLDFFECFNY